jgi:tetratricopeptide (TPR) repeat protein
LSRSSPLRSSGRPARDLFSRSSPSRPWSDRVADDRDVARDEELAWEVAHASACLIAGDVEGARHALEQALDQPPADPAEANFLGSFYFSRGRVRLAREVYLRAFDRWGGWPALLFNIAVCDLKLGMVEEARSYLEYLVSIRPRHRRAWTLLAVAYRRIGEDDLARNALVRAHATAERTLLVHGPSIPWHPDIASEQTETPYGATSASGFDAADDDVAPDEGALDERSLREEPISPDPADDLLAPQSQPSLVEAELAFIPRSVPVAASRGVRLPWFASRLVAAVVAAAAGFALAQGLAKRPPSRSASLAPPRLPAPRHHESGTLREAREEARTSASEAPTAEAPTAPTATPASSAVSGIAAFTGLLRTPESARGHRVFVDGRVRGGSGDPIRLPCGPHEVRVGSAGRRQQILVPCNGEIDVER